MKMKTEEIVLCEACKGKGTVEHSELEDFHHGTYKHWETDCDVCDGGGRLLKVTTIEYKKLSSAIGAKESKDGNIRMEILEQSVNQ